MKSLITGIDGFIGTYLKHHLHEIGHEVYGFDRNGGKSSMNFFSADILDKTSVKSVIAKVKPDNIFHLAAQSSVQKSFEDEESTFKINVDGTRNLLDAVLASVPSSKILVVSSPDIYGIPSASPIKETEPFKPISPYGKSRLKQEELVQEYIKKHDMHIVIARPFTQTGPRQKPLFVCPSFAKEVSEIESNLKEPLLLVGNPSTKRDITDVRDGVRSFPITLEKGNVGEAYHICSDHAYSIRQILDILLSFSSKKIEIRQDDSKKRKIDIPVLQGDNSKVRRLTGWEPKIKIEQTLSDILNYWREEIIGDKNKN